MLKIISFAGKVFFLVNALNPVAYLNFTTLFGIIGLSYRDSCRTLLLNFEICRKVILQTPRKTFQFQQCIDSIIYIYIIYIYIYI